MCKESAGCRLCHCVFLITGIASSISVVTKNSENESKLMDIALALVGSLFAKRERERERESEAVMEPAGTERGKERKRRGTEQGHMSFIHAFLCSAPQIFVFLSHRRADRS